MDLQQILAGMKNGTINPQTLIMSMLGSRNFDQKQLEAFAEFAKSQGANQADIDAVIAKLSQNK